MVIFIFLMMIIFIVQPQIAEAVWFDTSKETAFLKSNAKHLVYADGFLSVMFNQISWLLIKGLYWSTSSIENLIPESFSLFNFVNSSSVSSVYKSVINTIVVGLMVISLVIIGYKMVLGKGNLDLKSVGMNVVMSVCLILLMPTMITSGIEFAKVFYKDATSISQSDQAVSWSLIEENVTDLVLINKNKNFQNLNQNGIKRNSLNKEYFYPTNFSEVLTDKVVEKMKKENDQADYLNYQLTINSEGQPEAVKISDGFLSMFSEGFKTGYFRYKANFFPIILGLLALAIAYVFSLIVIISSIIELAFKKIIGVLVFATDLETGQKSKMVLSDIMQTFLTIGFQGFGLSMFALFISYLESTQINIIIKIIAYICAVFVLIKGSQSIMRYFGVDIGLKEGYGQLASTFALGAGVARKAGPTPKVSGRKSETSENEERKPEKNFGESLSKKAQKIGSGAGYAKERGLSGLASDGTSALGNQLARPFKAVHDVTEGASKGLKEGYNQGTAEAISKNMKSSNGQNNQGKEDTPQASSNNNQQKNQNTDSGAGSKVMSSSERMRMSEQMNQSRNPQVSEVQERVNATSSQSRNPQVSEVQERVNATSSQSRNPQVSEVQERVNAISSQSRNPQVSEVQERVNATSSQSRNPQVSEVQERVNATSSQSRNPHVSEVQERVNSTGSSARSTQTVDVQERLNSAGSSTRNPHVSEVQERVNSAGSSARGTQTVDVQERVNSAGSSARGTQTVDVQERVNSAGSSARSTQTVDVQTNISSTGSKNESVIVEKEVKEKDPFRSRFTIDDNPLFQEPRKDNPLFDFNK